MATFAWTIVLIFIAPTLADNDEVAKKKNGTCSAQLSLWAQNMTRFQQCVVHEAVPFKYCTQCVDEYVEFVKAFQLLTTETDPDNLQHRCRDYYLDQDRIGAIWKSYQTTVDLWESAACTSCFVESCNPYNMPVGRNTSDVCSPSKRVNDTHKTLDGLKGCLNSTETDKCNTCLKWIPPIQDLGLLKPDANFCFEVVNEVNQTMNNWYHKMNCPAPHVSGSTVSTILLTLLVLIALYGLSHGGYVLYKRYRIQREYVAHNADDDVPCLT